MTEGSPPVAKARLLELLRLKAFEKKQVTLSSGKTSDFYIDCKRVILTAEGHHLVGEVLGAEVRARCPKVTGVGGLTMGADPIASAISTASFPGPRPFDAFYVRKEPKGHGTAQWVEGLSAFASGAHVAVVEDVVTTGASMVKAIERAKLAGLHVDGSFALVDREDGGREAIEATGVPLWALFSKRDFL